MARRQLAVLPDPPKPPSEMTDKELDAWMGGEAEPAMAQALSEVGLPLEPERDGE